METSTLQRKIVAWLEVNPGPRSATEVGRAITDRGKPIGYDKALAALTSLEGKSDKPIRRAALWIVKTPPRGKAR